MGYLRKIFSKYTGTLRGMKVVYVLNNLLNRNRLRHNKTLYKKYGVKRPVIAAVGSHHFTGHKEETPWLDRETAQTALRQHPQFTRFDPEVQEQLMQFIEKGFIILRGFYSPEAVDGLNREVDQLLNSGKADFNYTQRKIMDAYQHSDLIDRDFFRNPEMLELLSFIMGRPVIPFQTINFIKGSEQRAHSDSIHMTTHPFGYLIATWTALETINDDNGLLFYYPGSHRLPYVTCQSYNSGNTRWMLGKNSYRNYEDFIGELIRERKLQPAYFHAEPGDVLIWHANLLHGGAPIKDPARTRRSMVAHYYCENVICYHEISQRPALLTTS